jgi:class 3 adenylate cyclase
MFTDIQGYTALMQESESKALIIRDKHRKVFDGITEKYGGSIINYYGDGTLSIFEREYHQMIKSTYILIMQHICQPELI